MRTNLIAVLLAVALGSGATASAAQQALSRVRALLEATQAVTVFDHVTAFEEGRTIRLEGKVTSRAKREQLESEVATVPGVHTIVNRVAILSSSPADEALRLRIAREIYGHPSFRAYAAMTHPPIRVLVDRGRVTLAGTVRSGVERQVAIALAQDAAGAAVDDQLRLSGA